LFAYLPWSQQQFFELRVKKYRIGDNLETFDPVSVFVIMIIKASE